MRYPTFLATCKSVNLLTSRTITSSSEVLGKCMPKQDGATEVKSKSSVTVKKFSQYDVHVIQAKKAADVIKKLNFENSRIFGSVVPFTIPKIKRIRKDDFLTPFETCVPIKEPLDSESLDSESHSVDLLKPQPLNDIFDFPLFNLNTELKRNLQRKSMQLDKYINRVNYLRKHLQSICGSKTPSVAEILDKTIPPESAAILERRKSQMMEQMGKEAFEEYQKGILSTGSSLLGNINDFFCEVEDLQIDAENHGYWRSIQTVLPNIKDITLHGERATHPFLQYNAAVDMVGKYRGHLAAIVWKTSQKQKVTLSSTDNYPLQIAAYLGAVNFDPRFEYVVKNGLIVIAYERGTPASACFMNETVLKDCWNKWLQRLKLFWEVQ